MECNRKADYPNILDKFSRKQKYPTLVRKREKKEN